MSQYPNPRQTKPATPAMPNAMVQAVQAAITSGQPLDARALCKLVLSHQAPPAVDASPIPGGAIGGVPVVHCQGETYVKLNDHLRALERANTKSADVLAPLLKVLRDSPPEREGIIIRRQIENDPAPTAVFSVMDDPSPYVEDLSLWLIHAAEEKLLKWQKLGWTASSTGPGAKLARELASFFSRPENDAGFSVQLHGTRVLAWLKRTRPDVWAELYCAAKGAILLEMGTGVMRGDWHWRLVDANVRSVAGFSSRAVAAKDLEKYLTAELVEGARPF